MEEAPAAITAACRACPTGGTTEGRTFLWCSLSRAALSSVLCGAAYEKAAFTTTLHGRLLHTGAARLPCLMLAAFDR